MPVKIPVYQTQVSPQLTGQPQARGSVISGAVGEAMSRAGAMGLRSAEILGAAQDQFRANTDRELLRQEMEEAKVWSAEAMSRLRIHADDRFRHHQSNAQPGASGFTSSVVGDFDTFAEETLKNAPKLAIPIMKEKIAGIRDNIFSTARTYEHTARADWKVRQISTALDNTSRLLFNDPAHFSATYEEQTDLIQSLDIPPNVKDNVLEAARRKNVNAAVSGWIAQNPNEAFAMLKQVSKGESFTWTFQGGRNSEVPWGRLNATEQQHWLAYAERVSKQENTVEKRRMVSLLKDAEAAADNGIATPIPEERFAIFGSGAPDVVAQYRRSQTMARDIATVSALPVAERFDLVQKATPKEGGEGFAEAEKRAGEIARAVSEANRRQAADPAAYAIQVAPQTVGKAFAAYQNALGDQTMPPEDKRVAAQAYADAVVAEQERLGGVPNNKRLRGQVDAPILPVGMAQALAKQFMSPKEGGQGPAQLLQQQADTWGEYWPAVYKQIAKDIGSTARVVANLRDTPAAALLSMNAALKTEDLKKPVGTNATVINETIAGELSDFRESLVGWTTGGSQTFNDYEESARRNAYVYAAQGTKPAEAAKQAVRELIGEYYEFRGTVRLPRLPGIDSRGIDAGMNSVLKDAGKLKLRVPESVLGAGFTAEQMALAVKTSGFFVTLGDDSGVALWMNGNNGPRAIEGSDGLPITFTWRDLMDRAESVKRGPRVPTFQTTPGGAVTGRTN